MVFHYLKKTMDKIAGILAPSGSLDRTVIRAASPVLLAALILALPAHSQEMPPAVVGVDTVIIKPLSQTVSAIGRVTELQSGVVAARISAPIGKMLVEVGDRVETDQILARLVDDKLTASKNLATAQTAEAQARVKSAKARLTLTRQELSRLENLKTSPAYSPARHDDKRQDVAQAEGELAEAKANLDMSRANLKMEEINLYNADIRAPYGGVVSKRHTENGEFVSVGDPVVSLINDREWEIEADIPANSLAGLKPDVEVSFNLSGKGPYRATVRAIIPDENPRTRTRAVRFVPIIDQPFENIAANESVTLLIPTEAPRDILSVHKDAVISNQGQKFVYVVKDGTANIRPVTLGMAVGNRFEVLSGLKNGETVVIRGNERLQPGQKVTPESSS
ncbi:MAG: efflux RND transporter periplasmic adaptor subunit [Rhodospirillaceae bacterium]|nr:efflux RND transporter periplasmic adaptor subunit [Rhodospirillaceae bacterium]